MFESKRENLIGGNRGLPPKKGIPQYSEKATMERELKELQNRYHNTVRSSRKLEERCEDSQQKLREIRAQAVQLEKELNLGKSVISKLTEEKTTLEKNNGLMKEYIRKLEQTITQGPKGQLFADIHSKLQQELDYKTEQNEKLQIEIKSAQEILTVTQREVNILNNALDLKIDELKLKGDAKSGLLYELGENRQRITELETEALKLTEEVRSLSQQLENEKTKNEELTLIRSSNNEELLSLEKQIHDLTQDRDSLQKTAQEYMRERNEYLDAIEEANKTVKDTEKNCNEVKSKAEEQTFTLNKELAELKGQHKVLEMKNEDLKCQIESLKRQKDNAIEENTTLRQRNTEIQIELQSAQTKQQESGMENTRLDAFVREQREEVLHLSKLLEEQMQASTGTRLELDSVKSKLIDAERTLHAEQEGRQQTEKLLRDKLDLMLSQLDRNTTEKDQLKSEISEATVKLREAFTLSSLLEDEKKKLQQQVESLLSSKQLLHQTMTGQILALKLELEDNIEKNKRLNSAYEELVEVQSSTQDKFRSEQMKNRTLLDELKRSKRFQC